MLRALVIACAAVGIGGCVAADAEPQPSQGLSAPLLVRVLDVGQGDATLIENGTSRVLIDGGPEPTRMGALLDSLGLNDTAIDVVILTHQHADHLAGLRALFESKRNIEIRYFFENQDAYTTVNLAALRDSVGARVERGALVYRDTDDPCANGRPVCTITMNGGAKLHIMRPLSRTSAANDRSVAVKLVGPDSAAFSMWLAGDAEHDAIAWFLGVSQYRSDPGMRVDVLKADHHGSCNGVTGAYLEATRPSVVVASVGRNNAYGHMHEQAKAAYRARKIPWYRTDQNGTIEIRVPGASGAPFSVRTRRGAANMNGPSDKRSNQTQCR